MTDGQQDKKAQSDQLLNELYDEKPQTRSKAAAELGRLRDISAIADLAQVYEKDPDKNVRKAAADALRIFRTMEQQSFSDESDEGFSGGGSSTLLTRLRVVLVITLILSVLVNVGVVASRLIKLLPNNIVTPEPTTPSVRQDLEAALNKRLGDARNDATKLRSTWTALQGMQPRWVA